MFDWYHKQLGEELVGKEADDISLVPNRVVKINQQSLFRCSIKSPIFFFFLAIVASLNTLSALPHILLLQDSLHGYGKILGSNCRCSPSNSGTSLSGLGRAD